MTIPKLTSQGLLRESEAPEGFRQRIYDITDKGRAYCESLQQVPIPVVGWITEWPTGVIDGHVRRASPETVIREGQEASEA